MASSNAQYSSDAEVQASAALESYLKSNRDIHSVLNFIKPVSDAVGSKKVETSLEILWDTVLQRALSTPYDGPLQDNLVTFLKEIKSLPPHNTPAPRVYGLSLWSDLPLFGHNMRNQWNRSPGRVFHVHCLKY
jgi:Protein of unknown function (DUF3632)